MVRPTKRNAVLHRPALRPAPGMPELEVDPAVQVIEGNDDSDWALWEDSVLEAEIGAMLLDRFEGAARRDG